MNVVHRTAWLVLALVLALPAGAVDVPPAPFDEDEPLFASPTQTDRIGRILAPDWDPNASVRRNVDEFMSERMKKDVSKGNVLSTALEMKDFLVGLPQRLNRIMDAVANNDVEVKVKSVDVKHVMDGMQKIANRITTGLVLAALIVGASLLMRVQTSFTLFGYPGLAILCFLAAAAGGFWLVLSIFIQDYKDKKKIKAK